MYNLFPIVEQTGVTRELYIINYSLLLLLLLLYLSIFVGLSCCWFLTGVFGLTLRDLSDLSDYSQPHAHAALLKAAFCCARVVQFPSDVSLRDQLSQRFGGGFELHTWSNLPRGSGTNLSHHATASSGENRQ